MSASMVIEHPTPAEFWRAAESFLSTDRATNTQQLSGIKRILDTGARNGERFFTVQATTDPHDIVGSAIVVDSKTVFLCLMPTAITKQLAMHLRANNVDISGVMGLLDATRTFATAYAKPFHIHDTLMLYELMSAPDHGRAHGHVRTATHEDFELLMKWYGAFESEVHMIAVPTPLEERLQRRISQQQITLWIDQDMPVSFAATNALPAMSARIGPVYTPPELRSRGYAQAVTAAASVHLQSDALRTVFLFTDASNPASNKAYQRIGFRHVSDHLHLVFDAP